MEHFINIVMTTSITALIVLLVKTLLKNKISPRWQFAIWVIVAIRLMVPVLPESSMSIFNSVPQIKYIEQEAYDSQNTSYNKASNDITYLEQDNYTYNGSSTNENTEAKRTEKTFSLSNFFEEHITTIWSGGAALLLCYITIVYLIYSLRTKGLKIVKDPETISVLEECKRSLGITSYITVREGGDTPLLKGLLSPEIILPKGYTNDELKSVFTHELSHFKHRDILWNIIGTLLLCAYWYNPIVWYSFIVFKRDMEILCDYRVLQVYDNRKAYSTVLLKTALSRNKFILATTCMQNGKKDIAKRIKNIAYFKKPKVVWSILSVILVMVIMTGCLTNPIGNSNDIRNENEPELDYEKIYNYRTKYVGDASKVGNLINQLYYAKYNHALALKTDTKPYQITINYKLDLEANNMLHDGVVRLTDTMMKNVAIMFCLIENVDRINIAVQDDGAIYTFPRDRESFNDVFIEDVRAYSSSYDRFKNVFIPMLERENWDDVDFGVYITNKVDLYVWRNKDITGTDEIYYTIFPGMNIIKTEEQVFNLERATNSLEEVNESLSQYGETTHLSIRHNSSLTKEEMIELNEHIKFEGNTRGIGVFGDLLDNDNTTDNDKLEDIGQKVEELLELIMSSPLASSNPGDYIRAHQEEYETILKLGDPALDYMLAQFEEGSYEGLRGHIMMLLCIDILGDRNNVEQLEDGTYYSPREWYSRLAPYEAVTLPPFKATAENQVDQMVYLAALNHYSDNNDYSVTIVAPKIFGTHETDDELRIFTTVYYSKYKLYGINLSQGSGGVVPAAIIYTKNETGGYDFKEYIEAMDGSYFQSSIEEFCYPRDDIAREIMNHYGNYSDLFEIMRQNLIHYLKENNMKGIRLKEHDGTVIPLT